MRWDVIVIGAGLSGLHAALTLEQAGAHVLVLEAQSRVGGRVHSMRSLGSTTEVGGTYIGAGYSRVIAAARRHGVELMDVTPMLAFFREQDLVLDGETIRQAAWPTHPANDYPEADKHHLPWTYHRVLAARNNPLQRTADWLDPRHASLDISASEWLGRMGLSKRAIATAYGLNASFGLDAHDVSALLLLCRGAFSIAQRAVAPAGSVGFTVRGGVQRLPEAMAEALVGGVESGHVVTAVEVAGTHVTVRCANGRRFMAASAVAAVPPGVLSRISIDPPLPPLQAEALREVRSQPLTQIFFAPRSRFWERDDVAPSVFTDTCAGMFAAQRDRDSPTEVTNFAAWITGRAALALDRLTLSDAGRAVIAAVERARPSAKGQLTMIGGRSWGLDPWARGAWSYFRPGQVTRYARVMGLAHGRLCFCGDHLAVESRGMEAALESAERVTHGMLAA
jgi:monoamine oxidase